MRLTLFIFLLASLLLPADEATRAFVKKHIPNMHRILAALEEEGEEEDFEELFEEAKELREEFREILREDGKKLATAFATLHDGFSGIDIVGWRIEEQGLSRDEARKFLTPLFKKVIVNERLLDDRKPLSAEQLAERIEDELIEFLEDHDLGETVEIPDDLPLYNPPPGNTPDRSAILTGVTFDFKKDIVPHLEFYCFDCHDTATAKGDLDLETALAQTPFVRNRLLWENVAERIRSHDMPPRKSKDQPKDHERLQMRAWVHEVINRFDYTAHANPGYLPARRLTREEYNRTIRDLLGLDLRPADDFPQDFSGTSGFSNSANTLYLQTAQLDRYITAADNLIDQIRNHPEAWKKLTSGRMPLDTFLYRAYRRPPTEKESTEAHSQFQRALDQKKSPTDALADAFKFILVSPSFLLRIEEAPTSEEDTLVSPYDLASRLSYFLWSSTPDDLLLKAAAENKLTSSGERKPQIDRLLADPRSLALGEIFVGEWLGTHNLGPRIRKDPIDKPWCTESLMAAMRNETERFFHHALTENHPVAKLLTDNHTFLNEELARFYKIPGIEGEHMRRVKIEKDQRGGLLGHAAVLAVTSYPDRTSPVLRGTWILDTLLGTPPPPPPPNVPEIEANGGGRRAAQSLRRQLEHHRRNPNCASCHDQIDPLGFALESYADFGQFRSGVDNRGALPNGATFRGPAGLKLALVDTRLDNFARQIIRKMLAYALSRQLEYYDEAVVIDIANRLKPKGYPLREILIAVTESDPFLKKRLPKPNGR
ncbi:MAG: DUF1592 domain-containing protein [Akkermansiaceae bacterium]